MTKKPPCQDCCLRTVSLQGSLKSTVTFNITNKPGGGVCSYLYDIVPNIPPPQTNVTASLVGDNECGVGDLTGLAKQDFAQNPDRWESTGSGPGQSIEDQVNEWISDNCDFLLQTDGENFVNQNYQKEFTQEFTNRTRTAEFCGSRFNGFGTGGPQ
jgi:hypothetical protein